MWQRMPIYKVIAIYSIFKYMLQKQQEATIVVEVHKFRTTTSVQNQNCLLVIRPRTIIL